jgi:hypothetical protein
MTMMMMMMMVSGLLFTDEKHSGAVVAAQSH